jgi:hypothetical protein
MLPKAKGRLRPCPAIVLDTFLCRFIADGAGTQDTAPLFVLERLAIFPAAPPKARLVKRISPSEKK